MDAAKWGGGPRRIVANLPYNIGTELLIRWLNDPTAFESFTLMFQSEVAARLAAPVDTGAYGRLSILAQWLCEVSPLFNVNPKAFTPPPQVQSTVVQLIPRKEPLAPAKREILERVTASAFGQRRKMLRQSLMAVAAGTPFVDGERLCRKAAIDPTARAETLSVEQFCAIARALEDSNQLAWR